MGESLPTPQNPRCVFLNNILWANIRFGLLAFPLSPIQANHWFEMLAFSPLEVRLNLLFNLLEFQLLLFKVLMGEPSVIIAGVSAVMKYHFVAFATLEVQADLWFEQQAFQLLQLWSMLGDCSGAHLLVFQLLLLGKHVRQIDIFTFHRLLFLRSRGLRPSGDAGQVFLISFRIWPSNGVLYSSSVQLSERNQDFA